MLTAPTLVPDAPVTTQRPCPVCSGHTAQVLHHQRFVLFDDVPFPPEYDVVGCQNCGMCFADVPAVQRTYDDFYRDHSRYHSSPTAGETATQEWEQRRLVQTAKTVADFVGDRGARVLDVGCANGGLLAALKELGYRNLTGLDPSLVCADNVVKQAGCRGEVGTLADHPDLGRFDVVILSHVLEHVHDVQGAVLAIHDLLAPGGVAYVEVPDASRYVEILGVPFQDFNTEHINHFDGARLQQALSGLTLEEYGYKTVPSPPPYPYPAVFGFFRRGAQSRAECSFDRNHLGEKLALYVQRSRELWDAAERRLVEDLRPMMSQFAGAHRRLLPVVWGTGELTLKLLATKLGQSIWIGEFVDGNPAYWGRKLQGKAVMKPDDLPAYLAGRPSLPVPVPIVVCSTLHRQSILRKIERLGLANPVLSFSFPPPSEWEEQP